MYDYIPLVAGAIFVALGLFMVIAPKMSTKKELRDDIEQVQKSKRSGIVCACIGVVAIVAGLVTNIL